MITHLVPDELEAQRLIEQGRDFVRYFRDGTHANISNHQISIWPVTDIARWTQRKQLYVISK